VSMKSQQSLGVGKCRTPIDAHVGIQTTNSNAENAAELSLLVRDEED
jgi:hypothetical protein